MFFVCDDHALSCRINTEASICTAELLDIELKLQLNTPGKEVKSNSWSSRTRYHHCRLVRVKSWTIQLFPLFYATTCPVGHCFCWVPSLSGIQGKERADVLAKAVLLKTKQFYYIPYTDFNIFVYLDDILQGEWNINVTSKLFEVQPTIKRSFTLMGRRRDDIVLCRTRIGHAYFTNGYLLRVKLRLLFWNTYCKTCHSQVCKICAHQKEIFSL